MYLILAQSIYLDRSILRRSNSPHSQWSGMFLAVKMSMDAASSSGTQHQTHRCISCGKRRSSNYHHMHSSETKRHPDAEICSRSSCSRLKKTMQRIYYQPVTVVHLVYHYHNNRYDGNDSLPVELPAELPAQTSIKDRAEVEGDWVDNAFDEENYIIAPGSPQPFLNKSRKPYRTDRRR